VVVKDHYIGGGGEGNIIFGFEGSQTLSASPSGKGEAYVQD
jgi:hypothetical protein